MYVPKLSHSDSSFVVIILNLCFLLFRKSGIIHDRSSVPVKLVIISHYCHIHSQIFKLGRLVKIHVQCMYVYDLQTRNIHLKKQCKFINISRCLSFYVVGLLSSRLLPHTSFYSNEYLTKKDIISIRRANFLEASVIEFIGEALLL